MIHNIIFDTLNGFWRDSLLVVIAIFATLYLLSAYPRYRRLPPGPRSSFWDVKTAAAALLPPWIHFDALNKRYGPVVSFYQGKTPVVVLGTIKAATDLLDKKGKIFSSRPRKIVAGEIMSQDMRGLGMPYGQRWRNWRSLMQAGMGLEASHSYKALQSMESKLLLRDLLSEKDNGRYVTHLRRFAISIVICVSYGCRITSLDDPIVLAHQRMEELYARYMVEQHLVESWPILLKLPKFLQWFRHEPEKQRELDTKLLVSLLDDVKRRMSLGPIHPCTSTRGLEKQEDFGLNDVELAYALSSPFGAGVGTTLSTLESFILAMLHHPEAMQKAQAEIDAVVGRSRLPDFSDAESLPYVRAMVKETMRWRPAVPAGVAHSAIDEYTYQDEMYIPNGSTVFANIYSMARAEEMFPSPEKFDPERYLDSEVPSIQSQSKQPGVAPHSTFFFGFGRRICPGMHVANNSVFIIIARMLWAFNITPPLDSRGRPILPDSEDYVGILVSHPRPFKYDLEFRKGDAERQLIAEECRLAEEEGLSWI